MSRTQMESPSSIVCLRTTIAIHVSRSLKGTGGDHTTTGLQRAINLPGRQPALPQVRQAQKRNRPR
jgi:hypothetical protein